MSTPQQIFQQIVQTIQSNDAAYITSSYTSFGNGVLNDQYGDQSAQASGVFDSKGNSLTFRQALTAMCAQLISIRSSLVLSNALQNIATKVQAGQ
jgi:ATP phosphoribosyltransferase regulatory subunit HisZ